MPRRILTTAAACLATLAPPASAVSYHLTIDVPSRLGAADYVTSRIVRSDDALYTPGPELPAGTKIGALHGSGPGRWLFSPAAAATLDSAVYEARDVVEWSQGQFQLWLDGSAASIPAGARIDAVLLDAGGRTVVSFDSPVQLGATVYRPSDLVEWQEGSSFALYWSSQAAGVPLSSNVVGAAVDANGRLVLSFDVPTNLGGADYRPGDLVTWLGSTTFSLYFADPAWPRGSQLRDFSFFEATPAGRLSKDALTMTRQGGGDVRLMWTPSCKPADDYAIYEGALGEFTSHLPRTCSTGSSTALVLTPAAGATYYVVVPQAVDREGSYGVRSDGSERPPAAAPCAPALTTACP